jgi:hypothetical protein
MIGVELLEQVSVASKEQEQGEGRAVLQRWTKNKKSSACARVDG